MPESTTETTLPVERTEPVEEITTEETTTEEQGTVGEKDQTPSKKDDQTAETPVVAPKQPEKLPPAEVQKRIDRMYARLQDERKQRVAVEAQLAMKRQSITPTVDEDGEPVTPPPPPQLTQSDIDAALDRREREKKFINSEVHVFEQHPDALNEDGGFNMSSKFVQRYIELGKSNPMLATMENGPELAAAMVDKELGLDYKKGRTDEATRTTRPADSFTTSSTVAPPANLPAGEITATQQKVARRMGMTDKQYIDNYKSNQIKQTSWEIKPK